MHKIKLEEGAKALEENQRRLSPIMNKVIIKEILKMLDAEVIYPIASGLAQSRAL